MIARIHFILVAAVFSLALAAVPRVALANDPALLGRAMLAVEARDWEQAQALGRQSGALAFDIVLWHRLRADSGTFSDYADFAARRADWPGMPLLHKMGETRLFEASTDAVLAYFATRTPQTGEGSLALAAARAARGDVAGASAEVVRAWRSLELSEAEQAVFLARHAAVLAEHHGGRMAMLLDQGKPAQAGRMLELVTPGTRAVAAARIALQTDANGVDALIAAVPPTMAGSAGLARDRATWRMRRNNEAGAAELMLERSSGPQSLGVPSLWARPRAALVRSNIRAGNFTLAYRLASSHHLAAGADYADLEWLAGYAALKQGRASVALEHFRALGRAVSGPISLARAGYWQGRALEDLGQRDAARQAYSEAARHQTAFYGLLAAERAGLSMDPALIGRESLPDWRGAPFTASSVFQAAVLLRAAGQPDISERFLLHLGESLDSTGLAQLARLAEEWSDPHLGLIVAKAAADRGVVFVSAYYPLAGLQSRSFGVPPELVLAIARRESEFDPKVISRAGARGLMQVMPDTARMMAAKLGLNYDLARLTSDPDYNARLGAAYLAQLREEFGASVVLVAAGYNAGPGRPRRWVAEMGDPRAADVDVVDWIEMIPFVETRNYVMRVSESMMVYRARLSGTTEPIRLTDLLKGR
jgi:soluble lytic murein transglycosylase